MDKELPISEQARERLNKDDFESYIAIGTTKEELKKIFLASDKDLENFCFNVYKMDFTTVFSMIATLSLAEYKKCLRNLAVVGNATAINSLNSLILNMNNSGDVKITVNASVPKEEEK